MLQHRTVQWDNWTVCAEGTVDRRHRAVAPDSLGNSRIQRSTATDPNGRLTWQSTGLSSVGSVLVDRKLLISVQRLEMGFGPINTTPTGHFKVWEPKQHTKA
jgi:hypothetical protein